jgi:hypothetical protein
VIEASFARRLSNGMRDRTMTQRIAHACSAAAEAINIAIDREHYSTILDFERVDVQRGVSAALVNLGYAIRVSAFRSTTGWDGDAVPSLEVSW